MYQDGVRRRFTLELLREVRATEDTARELAVRVRSEGLRAALAAALDAAASATAPGHSELTARVRLATAHRQLRAIRRALDAHGAEASWPLFVDDDPSMPEVVLS
jgi:hypothetical protein